MQKNIKHKRTKIVATIGPATEAREMIERLLDVGMNVVRLNMSHGSHEEHQRKVDAVRAVEQARGIAIPIICDLSGPKIRTGDLKDGPISLVVGQKVTLTTDATEGTTERMHVTYERLPSEVKNGSPILLDDGKTRLVVCAVSGNDIECVVEVGGTLKSRRGVNVPGAYLSIASITEKDRADIDFGVAAGVDYFALSFVRTAADVRELRDILSTKGVSTPIISKIETVEALENLDAILAETDGVMVARGDLAIEAPTPMVPLYQKDIIRKCNVLGKPVITATQMLESMINSPVPTRAEVSDVANAIIDGTDAVMLSEESALGKYPIEAVRMMSRIAEAIEESIKRPEKEVVPVEDTIAESVYHTARDVHAVAIVALTEGGATARSVARFKPGCPIIALTPHAHVVEQLSLVRGVYPYRVDTIASFNDAVAAVPEFLKTHGLAREGDMVAVTAGLSFGTRGSTNTIAVIKV